MDGRERVSVGDGVRFAIGQQIGLQIWAFGCAVLRGIRFVIALFVMYYVGEAIKEAEAQAKNNYKRASVSVFEGK